MLLNCGVGEDSWESLGLQGDPISPEYSLEGLMLKLKRQYFGHLMGRTDSFEKTLMLGKIEGRKGMTINLFNSDSSGIYKFALQFSSVTQACPTLCDPVDYSTPGFCPSLTPGACSNSCPSSWWCHPTTAFNLSQHQSLFQWVSSSHQVAKVLELQLQHQAFQWIFRTDFL